jgi:5-methylcytosine-specific restriction enzyme subunit McrC
MRAPREHEILTESTPKAIALTTVQATALSELGKNLASKKQWWGHEDEESTSALEKSVIRCSPRIDGRWDVIVLNAVGVITIGDLDLFVEPKIPVAHAVHLFSRSDQFPRLSDDALKVQIATGQLLWRAIAQWFITSVEELLRDDLIKDYRGAIREIPQARGHIDVFATTQSFLNGRLGIVCEYDEFDADNALNRVLKAALSKTQRMRSLDASVRDRAARAVLRFDDVGQLRPMDLRVWVDRHASRYSDSVALAKHVLGGTARSIEVGEASARCFLLRTPDLIEAGVRSILEEALRDVCIVKKSGLGIPGTKMTLNPDLNFGDQAVGDVKYKTSDDWVRSDLYQAISFAVGFGVKRCAIVRFCSESEVSVRIITVGDVEVAHFGWPIATTPNLAEEQLAIRVKTWVTSAGIAYL